MTQTSTATAAKTFPLLSTTVVAESAPLGVQLWPTRSPEFAPNFTLASVTRFLDGNGRECVTWTYQNGNVRTFLAGEEVAVRIAA
jgi:hypothetical protein